MNAYGNPILKDHGIVLRWFPVTDTSRVVVWFTERHGRLSTLIKGSQRSKSWMLGQYDLFYTCEVLFYGRAREDLHILRECSPVERRSAFRRQWRCCAGASFVADLLYRVSPPLAAASPLYALATRTLDQLSGQAEPALLFWFELHLLRGLGVVPELTAADSGTGLFLDIEAGRIVPAGGGRSPRSAPVSGGVLALMRRLLELEEPASALRLKFRPEQIRELAGHLERFTAWHLDVSLPSRGLALDLMTR